jgi:hypothetical protein
MRRENDFAYPPRDGGGGENCRLIAFTISPGSVATLLI